MFASHWNNAIVLQILFMLLSGLNPVNKGVLVAVFLDILFAIMSAICCDGLQRCQGQVSQRPNQFVFVGWTAHPP